MLLRHTLNAISLAVLMAPAACGGDDGSAGSDGDSDTTPGDGDAPGSGGSGDGDGEGDGDMSTGGGSESGSCAETCAGCCDGETCVETPTDAQCGYSGAACTACQTWQSCGDDVDNFADFGECRAVGTSTWVITVDTVSAYAQKEGPDDWDVFDGPDLFVCLEVDGVERGCTSECTDSYDCSFNEVVGIVTYDEVESSSVALEVYDADLDTNDYGNGALVETSDLESGGFDLESSADFGFERLVIEIAAE